MDKSMAYAPQAPSSYESAFGESAPQRDSLASGSFATESVGEAELTSDVVLIRAPTIDVGSSSTGTRSSDDEAPAAPPPPPRPEPPRFPPSKPPHLGLT